MRNNNDINVLGLTFDDIKNNESLMSEIRTKWENIGFLKGLEIDEKYYNLCIAFEQFSEYFLNNTYDYNMLAEHIYLNKYFNINTEEDAQGTFEVIIFPILRKIYMELPLSDYDYKEIIQCFEKIDITEEELDSLNHNDTQNYYLNLLSEKIKEQILDKYND